MSEFFPACESSQAAQVWLHRRLDSGEPLWAKTSGSTGKPKCVQLSVSALTASTRATLSELEKVETTQPSTGSLGDSPSHDRHSTKDLANTNASAWVLALPLAHIAGWMVVSRAVIAGAQVFDVPGATDGTSQTFSASTFLHAARRAVAEGPWHTALVPVQLQRLVEDPEALSVLATARTVLLGGAAVDPQVLAIARAAGVKVRRTYGMTETCGGCVYDGLALPDVQIAVGSDSTPPSTNNANSPEVDGAPRPHKGGIVWVSGPMLADGYVDPATGSVDHHDVLNRSFVVAADGRRWHRTSDIGQISEAGVLQILGRADDVINTGGVKVAPLPLERAAGAVAEVSAVCVVGVPHPHWGEAVVAVVELADGVDWSASLEQSVADSIAAEVPRTHRPKRILCRVLPRRGIGKIDRQAVRQWAAALV